MVALVAAVALGALGVLGLVGIGEDEPPLVPLPPPIEEPPPEHKAAGFFGVSPQTHLTERDYRRMGQGKANILRVPLSWDNVQSVPGRCEPEPAVATCSWTNFDAIVGQAAAYGIRVLPTLGGRPEFTKDKKSDDYIRDHPPIKGKEAEAWRAFVRSAAARYGKGGAYWDEFTKAFPLDPVPIVEWQIWNEPNAGAYWPPKPRAKQYAKLVRQSATSIREGDPEAEIVLGGMFGTATKSSRKYLQQLYSVDGIEEYFDSIAIHPYSPKLQGVKVQAGWVRKVAEAAGDPEVGLWVTELGWGSGKSGHPLERGPKLQAKLLDRSFRLLLQQREAWNVEGVTWFTWEDRRDRKVCRFCRHAGLFDARDRAKPAWEVFKRYARKEVR